MKGAPGPLFEWLVPRTLRESNTLLGAAVFGLVFYGVLALTLLGWAGAGVRGALRDLLSVVHGEALVANAIVLLLWSPSRLAQRLAREREQDTLPALRLTGLGGLSMALGFLGSALVLPAVLLVVTSPVILAGAGGRGGPAAPLRAYAVLLLLAVVYHLVAGVVGLASKKAQNAGGTTVFVVLVLLGLGAAFRVPGLEVLGVLGPWGAAMASSGAEQFDIPILGVSVAGEPVQLVTLALLAAVLLRALSDRLADERAAVLVGAPAAAGLAALGAALAALTYEPFHADPSRAVFLRLLALGLAAAPLALEAPARFADLARGAARRDPDDPPFPDERLDLHRLLPGPLLLLGGALLLGLQLPSGASWGLRTGVAAAVLVTAWTFAALLLQAARLLSRDRGSPVILVVVALAALWCAPLLSSAGLRNLAFDERLTELPRLLNPAYALYLASTTRPVGGHDPLALATACAAVHALAALGAGWLVRQGERRVTELVGSLVVLPADAYDAPGTLERRCPRGHLHAAVWATCPHC